MFVFKTVNSVFKIFMWVHVNDLKLCSKALQNWKMSVKALTKRLWKLTIKTKQLLQLKLLSFDNVNN